MFPKIAQIALFIGVIALPARAQLGGLLGSGSAACQANEAVVSCGLLDVSLQCEKQCNDTQVCVNVCTNLINTVSGVLSLLPIPVPLPAISACKCEDGFYRDRAGSCVGLDLCAHTGINLKKRQALPVPLPSLPIPSLPIPSLPIPSLPGLGSGSGLCPLNETAVSCGLLDVSLQCEKQCNDTQVCANVCTNLINTVSGVLSLLPLPVPLPAISTCMCEDGFYRNSAGSCVALDLCLHTGINLKKRQALPVPLPPLPIPSLPIPSVPGLGGASALCPLNEAVVSCGLLDVSLQCEKQCDDTQVCANVCTNLINTVSGVLSLLPLPVPLPAISTCMCEDGFYRDRAGGCVALDLCLHTGINL